ncbi:MAG: hypothetical protein ACLF0P_04890 [Thermoanaerobaculia bacterium]
MTELQVEVRFRGLIVFVQDGDSGRITHALLREGRAGHHGLGHNYPADGDCSVVTRADFDHSPKVSWRQGSTSGSVDLVRQRLALVWAEEQGSGTRGAVPEPGVVGTFPDFRDASAKSFSWVPKLDELGPDNPVSESCLGIQDVHPAVVGQVVFQGGTLETGEFASIKGSPADAARGAGDLWIPRLAFTTALGEPHRVSRAAAEEVSWRPPADASWIELRTAEFRDDGADPVWKKVAKFDTSQPAQVRVDNQSARVCHAEPHPGRVPGAPGMHFTMFYDLLLAPVIPALRRIPWLPSVLRSRSRFMRPRTVVEAPDSTYDGFEGTVDRPLCVPATASSE